MKAPIVNLSNNSPNGASLATLTPAMPPVINKNPKEIYEYSRFLWNIGSSQFTYRIINVTITLYQKTTNNDSQGVRQRCNDSENSIPILHIHTSPLCMQKNNIYILIVSFTVIYGSKFKKNIYPCL
jgi:hypothetical protein